MVERLVEQFFCSKKEQQIWVMFEQSIIITKNNFSEKGIFITYCTSVEKLKLSKKIDLDLEKQWAMVKAASKPVDTMSLTFTQCQKKISTFYII